MASGSDERSWPSDADVQAVHERYQKEVVEGLNLCPFARKSRELGRVHRPVFRVEHPQQAQNSTRVARHVARSLFELLANHPDTEIVLLTFPVRRTDPWMAPKAFEGFLPRVKEAYAERRDAPTFYMVTFHPQNALARDTKLTQDNLVPLIRRTPDPVIQCVSADTLDAVRRQAQVVAQQRMRRELLALNPELAGMLDRSIAPDPELSSDIARANFQSVGEGAGRRRLDELVAQIWRERTQRYGDLDPGDPTPRAPDPVAPDGTGTNARDVP